MVAKHEPSAHLSNIEQKLKSQKTFEAALEDLKAFAVSKDRASLNGELAPSLQHIFKRVIVLLRSRYTTPGFWQAAKSCFLTFQAVLGRESHLKAQIDGSIQECQRFLRSSDEPIQSQPPSLFEGQLSRETEAEQPQGTVEQILSQLFASRLQTPDGAVGQHSNPPTLEISEELLRELEEQQIASLTAAGMLADQPNAKAPPASRRAVKRLKKIVLDQDALKAIKSSNAEVLCSICQEDFVLGDTMSIMPCSSHHSFHPPCLQPWLKENNSCPICRFELETDDMRYEAEKQRKLEDAAALEGSRNAQSHNDFLYI